MNKRQFVSRREDAWLRFEKLLNRFDRAVSKPLSTEEATEFSRIFRELCHDLSVVRSRNWGRGLASYLNDLVSRGHNAFYRAPPTHLSMIAWFLSTGFPRVFRRNIWYFVAAALLFFGPLAVTWAVVQNQPELARRIASDEALAQMQLMYPVGDGSGSSWKDADAGSESRVLAAGFYTQHNI
ncbi:MAG: stage II sporulation protein M, partial [Planctomycetaceae bacterium]